MTKHKDGNGIKNPGRKMTAKEMIDSSDAIAKIKFYRKNGKDHCRILKTFRGSFDDGFEKPAFDPIENRPYLCFYKKENVALVPVDGENSFLLIEGDMGDIFKKIKEPRP